MTPDYFRCGICGVQLTIADSANLGRFPATRRFRDRGAETGLIAVRCAQCADLPYKLKERQPHRVHLINEDDVVVIPDCNSEYNYYAAGIGHLLEVFVSDPTEEKLNKWRNDLIEIGFLVEEDVNLIVVAYRLSENRLNVTPYSWHAHTEWTRAVPPLEPETDADQGFTVAFVNTRGGKYEVIRESKMPAGFSTQFHAAIHSHIEQGAPDWKRYRERAAGLGSLLYEDRVNSELVARCFLE